MTDFLPTSVEAAEAHSSVPRLVMEAKVEALRLEAKAWSADFLSNLRNLRNFPPIVVAIDSCVPHFQLEIQVLQHVVLWFVFLLELI